MTPIVHITFPLVTLIALLQGLITLALALPVMAILAYMEYRLIVYGVNRWVMPTLSKLVIMLSWLSC